MIGVKYTLDDCQVIMKVNRGLNPTIPRIYFVLIAI